MCKKCEDIDSYSFAKNEAIGYYKSRKKPDGQYCIVYDHCIDGDETGERSTIDIENCPWCGKNLSELLRA